MERDSVLFGGFIPYEFLENREDEYWLFHEFVEISNCRQEDISYYLNGKKLIALFGDETLNDIGRMLNLDPDFCGRYHILKAPHSYWINSPRKALRDSYNDFYDDEFLFKCVDIFFIYAGLSVEQPLVYKKIEESAQIFSLPPMIFYGYFPQAFTGEDFYKNLFYHQPAFLDRYIEGFLSSDLTGPEIAKKVLDPGFIDREELLRFFEKSLIDFRENEVGADIKISDWLSENYKRKLLFTSPFSLGLDLCMEVSDRILNYFIEERNGSLHDKYSLLTKKAFMPSGEYGDCLLYPSVADLLDFECSNICYSISGQSDVLSALTREEFVDEYARIRRCGI